MDADTHSNASTNSITPVKSDTEGNYCFQNMNHKLNEMLTVKAKEKAETITEMKKSSKIRLQRLVDLLKENVS